MAKAIQRLMSKVSGTDRDSCVRWIASVDKHGYGQFRFRGTTYRTHRAAYILLVGEIPEGMDLDHLCSDPRCVNPDHLEPVTHAENVRRGNAGRNWAAKTHCPRGHEYTPDNVIRHCQSGARVCRTCDLERKRIYNKSYVRKSRRKRIHKTNA